MKNYSKILWKGALAAGILMAMPMENAGAAYPQGYYDSLNGKCGVELMRAVKAKVASHTEISYGSSGTWRAFKDTDVKTVNGVDYWWDMYSNNLVKVGSGGPGEGMNIEHSVANSWWGGSKNAAYRDIVHLNPSDRDANSRKSNYPLSELSNVTWTNGVTNIGTPKSGQGGGAGHCYEPADEYKGDFARVFMYMFTVYDNISWKSGTAWMYDTNSDLMFKAWAKELLLRWSATDPVSDKERKRNDGIYKHQKNRNPFIDLPDLADHIWGSKSNVPYDVENAGDPEIPGDPTDPEDPDKEHYMWLASTDADMGDWTIQNVTLPSGGSYVWKWDSYNGNGYLKGSAYIQGTPYEAKAYAWSPVVSFTDVTAATMSFKHAAKYQTTLKTLCKAVVKDEESGEITELSIPQWPAANKWNFSDSGNIDLTAFKGKKVRVGFKYESNTDGADQWEINDVKLDLVRTPSGIDGVIEEGDEDDSFLVEVWGNNILAPEGARIFDMNGREFDGAGLQRGIYIVVKPTFGKAVKVMVK